MRRAQQSKRYRDAQRGRLTAATWTAYRKRGGR